MDYYFAGRSRSVMDRKYWEDDCVGVLYILFYAAYLAIEPVTRLLYLLWVCLAQVA